MATNYFYIDEAGDLVSQKRGGSRVFILSCIVTNNPRELVGRIKLLEAEIQNKQFYARHSKQFKKDMFHAAANHLDIYTRFLDLLVSLNFRAYVLVLDKTKSQYLNYLRGRTRESAYDNFIAILLKDRLIKRRLDSNFLCFEQNLTRPTSTSLKIRKNKITEIVNRMNSEFLRSGLINKKVKFKVELRDKKERGFAVVDYINHVLFQIYSKKKNRIRRFELENLRLVESKIGSINDIVNKKIHQPRKRRLNIS